jgi:5'-3' exonuclease
VNRRPPKNGIRNEKKNALLIDGNALLKIGYHGAKNEYNHFGKHIGGLYQFLTILRKLLDNGVYHNVFVFWDGPLSGKLRYEIYKDYKSNRSKNYETGTVSQDEDLVEQKARIWDYLEQLCIRQMEHPVVESDDFIGYFCRENSDEYNITICTTDRDMAQLINDSVRIYFADLKQIVSLENYQEIFTHHPENAMLIKMISGDNSDCIKGVKGVKEGTLLKHFPVLTERKVSLEEIIHLAKILQQDRIDNKKKPLKAIQNLIEGRTDGSQGERLYEINRTLVDLKSPLMTEDAIELFEIKTESPINPEGRSAKSVYQFMKEDGLDRLINEHKFVNYMLPFKKIINKEKEAYKLWLEE